MTDKKGTVNYSEKKPIEFEDVVDGLRSMGCHVKNRSAWAYLDSNMTVLNRAVAEIARLKKLIFSVAHCPTCGTKLRLYVVDHLWYCEEGHAFDHDENPVTPPPATLFGEVVKAHGIPVKTKVIGVPANKKEEKPPIHENWKDLEGRMAEDAEKFETRKKDFEQELKDQYK